MPRTWERALAIVSSLLLAYFVACKFALFVDLEYWGSDFYSSLEMSRSFLYTGIPLYDNTYGHSAAIHNNYLLLLFFPLTYPLGGYGLILGLAGLYAWALARVLRTTCLSFWGRLAVVGTILSPLGFWVFDDPVWGFHPELCYPPLSLLFVLWWVEGRFRAAFLAALAVVLVKEDGPVVVAVVLLADYCVRVRLAEHGRLRLLRSAAALTAVCLVLFVAGLALQKLVAAQLGELQASGERRILESIRTTLDVLAGGGKAVWSRRLRQGLLSYAGVAVACGLPLVRRFPLYASAFAVSAPALVFPLVLSSALYGFDLLWSPRLATLLALVAGCLVVTAARAAAPPLPGHSRGRNTIASLALVLVGWIGSWAFLERFVGYHFWPRVSLLALAAGDAFAIERRLHADELQFARCLAASLPRDLPVAIVGAQAPLFHRQSLVFPGARAPWRRPRLAIALRQRGGADPPGLLARVRRMTVSGDEELGPLARRCAEAAGPEGRIAAPP